MSPRPSRKNPYPGAPTGREDLHPLVVAASTGELPPWTRAGKTRRKHMARVAALLEEWATGLQLGEVQVIRWTAAGFLHDVLREAKPSELRPLLAPAFRDAPGNLLHGPAAAFYLQRDGVRDHELLDAIAYHTVGHPSLRALGQALYAADFLEPGRKLRPKFRASLRDRMPADMDGVMQEIVGARIAHLVDRGKGIRPETISFWNELVGGTKKL